MIKRSPDYRLAGFTLVEMIMIILLLTVISVSVATKWPTDMEGRAARLELKQAIRFSQSMALTREWQGASNAWGITILNNKYYVGRANANCVRDCSNPECAEELLCSRYLLGDDGMTIRAGSGRSSIWFNGIGEPIQRSGALLTNTTFTVDTNFPITVCAQTGYVLDGGSCP